MKRRPRYSQTELEKLNAREQTEALVPLGLREARPDESKRADVRKEWIIITRFDGEREPLCLDCVPIDASEPKAVA